MAVVRAYLVLQAWYTKRMFYIEWKMKFKRYEMESSKTYIDCFKQVTNILPLNCDFKQKIVWLFFNIIH